MNSTPKLRAFKEEKLRRLRAKADEITRKSKAIATAAAILASQIGPLPGAELPHQEWVQNNFPHVAYHPNGDRHDKFWHWIERLLPGARPRALIAIWPRGGGKSTTIELGVARVGIKLTRRFVLYVSGTQKKADEHVSNIGKWFESLGVDRAVNVYGQSEGWKHNELHTANGFVVIAYGLDSDARGIKVGELRPDLIVLDDVDSRHDSPATIEKKKAIITDSLLPAGSTDCAVVFVQNRIHETSIASQLADGKADFLHDREPVSEEPALIGMKIDHRLMPDGNMRYVILEGIPTWAGQDLATCEWQMNAWGYASFMREAQHQVKENRDGLWQIARDIEPFRLTRDEFEAKGGIEFLIRIGTGVDPNTTEGGDACGIISGGIARAENGRMHAYILADDTTNGSPRTWAAKAVKAYQTWNGDVLVAESNQGGEMVEITISTIDGAPPVKLVHASRGKVIRAEPIQALYEKGLVHHVGRFIDLEDELSRWKPGMKPSPNRLDALVWLLTELLLPENDGLNGVLPSQRFASSPVIASSHDPSDNDFDPDDDSDMEGLR